MREILFRGKRKCNGEWVYGSLILWNDGDTEICILSSEEYAEQSKVLIYSETVGQFTGLTDKNGKKIFEGDIFIFPEIRKHKYVVEWDANYACFDCFNDVSGFDASSIEVIGNIHDNPELLETK